MVKIQNNSDLRFSNPNTREEKIFVNLYGYAFAFLHGCPYMGGGRERIVIPYNISIVIKFVQP